MNIFQYFSWCSKITVIGSRNWQVTEGWACVLISKAGHIRCTDLWKVFGRTPDAVIARLKSSPDDAAEGHVVALREISLTVEPGETCVVMGLSGSGKSTLVRCLTRLIEPDAGRVEIDGTDVLGLDARGLRDLRQKKLAMVFQHFGLFPHLNVIENVAYGLEVRGIDKRTRLERAADVIALVGLAGRESAFPAELSGGMQQRVGIARALAVDPEILFFDEPFSALDPLIRTELQDELLRLQAEMKKTILFITHDFNEAIRLGDQIVVMKDGQIQQKGTAAEIVTAPANDYVRNFALQVPLYTVQTAGQAKSTPTDAARARFAQGVSVASSVALGDLVNRMLQTEGPLPVVAADGSLVGELRPESFLRAMQKRV